jgi:polyhydroxybutyrate depolymerase
MLAHLSERLCIDPARVYANGLSNGGGMTNRLACEASDMIAAIGGVAGAYSPVTCNISRPVPVIAFHGDKDSIVEYEGNAALGFPAYQDWGKAWAERNGCDLTPTLIPQVDDVRGVRYAGCQAGADVVVYTVEGGGHVWPGGPELRFLGKTSKVDATPLMWDFFKLHPMR